MVKNKSGKKSKNKMTLLQKRIAILSITSIFAFACIAGMIVAILAVVGVI